MEIKTTDTRWLQDITPINFKSRNIIFYDMTITGNFAWNIEDMLEWNNDLSDLDFKKIEFNNDINIYDLERNFMILESSSKNFRNMNMESLKNNFQKDWNHYSKLLENNRHIPDICWYFDYNDKYYIVIRWLNTLTDEINPEKWIYKWVIIDSEKYFEVSNEVQKVVSKIEQIL